MCGLLCYFHDISCQHLLEHLPLILVRRETKGGYHHVTLVEPARRQVAQHGVPLLKSLFPLLYQYVNDHLSLQLVCDGKGTAKKKEKPPTQWVRVGGTDCCKSLIISSKENVATMDIL